LGQLHSTNSPVEQLKLSHTHKLHLIARVKLIALLVHFTEAAREVLHQFHFTSHVPPNIHLTLHLMCIYPPMPLNYPNLSAQPKRFSPLSPTIPPVMAIWRLGHAATGDGHLEHLRRPLWSLPPPVTSSLLSSTHQRRAPLPAAHPLAPVDRRWTRSKQHKSAVWSTHNKLSFI
jgi:hypothetical protein